MSAIQSTALDMVKFLHGVLRSATWGGVKYIPYAMVSSLGLSLATGLVLWVWATPQSGLAAEKRAWLEPLFLAVYLIVGLVWAIGRVLDQAGAIALESIQSRAPAILNPLFDSLAAYDPLAGRELSVAELREKWHEARRQMTLTSAGRLAFLGRLAHRIAHFWIDRQSAVVREILDQLALEGDSRVDVVSLGRLFQQRAVKQLVDAGKRQLTVWRLWFSLPMLAAALLPPALCWLVASASG
jgi:hypothetical protein